MKLKLKLKLKLKSKVKVKVEVKVEVKFGSSCVVPSEGAEKWAQETGKVKAKQRGTRLEESKSLLENYSEKYNWWDQTRDLIEKMRSINRKGR